MTVQNTTFQIDVNCAIRYTPKCRKDVHINIGPYQEGFLWTSIMGFIADIHTNIYTNEITPEWAKMLVFIFMSKVNLGTLPSTQNTFSVLLESICHIKALITNCDKSLRRQGFLNCRNLWLSQFVTVQNTTSQIYFIVTEGILQSSENMFTSRSDPFKKVTWVHRL